MNRIFFISLFIFDFALKGSTPYEFGDLETLYKENNFQEFLNHALDIRPSQRDQKWKKMVMENSENFIRDKISRKQFDEKTLAFIESLANWPVLKEDEIFFLRRNEFGIKFFEECFVINKKEACFQKINKFWNNTTLKNPDLGLNLATLLSDNAYDGGLWEYVTFACNSNVSEFYCKNSLIKKEILKKIQTIMASNLSQFDQKIAFQNAINESCLKTIIPEIKKAFLEVDSALVKEVYLKFLNINGGLDPKEKDFFLTLYYLQSPVIGDLFNESWNTIQTLGQNYYKRMAVMDKLKELSLLPDEIFSSTNEKKKEALLSHFYKNFPEYLDFYAKTCIEFLEGKKNYPNGNPTLRCKDLFQSTEILDPSIQSKYKSLKKFEKKA